MLASFKKWQKVDELPPLVDEIAFFDNQGNYIQQGNENILIFLDLQRFNIEEQKAEIIDFSQIIEKFIIKVCQKYLPYNEDPNYVQMMMGNGLTVNRKQKFRDYAFKSNMVVIFKKGENFPKSNKVFIEIPTGKIIIVYTHCKSVYDVKKEIFERGESQNYPPEDIRMTFAGKSLDDNKLFDDYQVKEESKIYMFYRLRGGGSGFFPQISLIELFNGTIKIIKEFVNEVKVPENKIYIEINGIKEEFEVLPYFLIQQIKVIIQNKKGIPIQSQQLYHKGVLMKDEFALEDYYKYDNYKYLNQKKQDPLILKVLSISKEQQQDIYQNTDNNNIITIIVKNEEYRLSINKNSNKIDYQDIALICASSDEIKRSLILCNGKPYGSIRELKDKQNVQSIFFIDQQSGGIQLKFTLQLNDKQVENISKLKDSLQWLGNCKINEFIECCLQEINNNQLKKQDYQQIPLHCIIAIQLYTSNLIYRNLNQDLRTTEYENWKQYLKCLMEGLRYMKYYKGVAYRGIKNYQNTTVYQKGKIVQWSEVSSVSLKKKIAQNFSNSQGMIFQVELISAKDIGKISIYEGEQELLMYPFSNFIIDDVQVIDLQQPLIVTMRELPLPRSTQVLLWVDDNPENNYQFAEDLEKQNNNFSVIFCVSTQDAILIIEKYKWMIYLEQSQFRVVSDMVRVEQGQINYTAGIDLIQHLYQQMKYKNRTLIFCGDQMRAQEECKKRNIQGNFEITNSQQVLMKFLSFQ